jgi:uncharacterized protein (DUF2141 family)
MQKLLHVTAALILGSATSANAGELTVTVENVRAGEGAVYAALCDAACWKGEAPAVRTAHAPAGGARVTLRIADAPSGRFGLRIYQDRNGDGRLGRGLMGIPSEPYAFSNNAPANLGPAKFEDAAFEVGAGAVAQSVRLN